MEKGSNNTLSLNFLDNYPEAACVLDSELKLIYSNHRGLLRKTDSLPLEVKLAIQAFLDEGALSRERFIHISEPLSHYHLKLAAFELKDGPAVLATILDDTSEYIINTNTFQRSEELSILNEISALKTKSLETESIVGRVVEKLTELTDLERAFFVEIRNVDNKTDFELHYSGHEPELYASVKKLIASGKIPFELLSHTPNIWHSGNEAPPWLEEVMENYGVLTLVKIPAVARGKLMGFVILVSHISGASGFYENNRFFRMLSRQLSSTLERALLFLELEKSFRELDKKNRINTRHLELAQRLQAGILEIQFPDKKGIEFAAKYIPSHHLGGDFYDVFEINENSIGVLIADVCGHGVSSALVTTYLKAAARELSKKYEDPAELLGGLNLNLVRILPLGMFASAFYIIINLKSREILFSNGGHPLPLLYDAGQDTIGELDVDGRLLSLSEKSEYFTRRVKYSPGDKVFMFTDGLYEIEDSAGNLLGADKLQDIIFENRKLPAQGVVERIMGQVYKFAGKNDLSDDINLIAIDLG